ncbi:MAG TPA: DUF362 domain-containing protein, partial [Bryobacteraceae bacterium]|nr:DUF362 domain-containing protein [Bryobacteraceae bacterium]
MRHLCPGYTRRFLLGSAAATAGTMLVPKVWSAENAPTAPVAVARCLTYERSELLPTMQKMFADIGGLERIVKGKTVAIKINLTGAPRDRLGYLPAELAHWTHPAVIGTAVHLMGKAGAKRVRLLESAWNTADPIEEYMMEGGWDPATLLNAAPRVEMENTNWLGNAKKYSVLKPPNGGHMFKAYHLNHSYEDCDVFVSIAKLKDHATAGITLSMKNCFGITPCTIYGDGAPKDGPSDVPHGGRGSVIHAGKRQPAATAPAENDPNSPRDGGYRVPRVVADLVAARPIHLAIIDGIESMAGGEGPWIRGCVPVKPGILIAGTNCVTTDAVAAAAMGYDPMADRGKVPFETADSTLKLAEMHGVGTRDLR